MIFNKILYVMLSILLFSSNLSFSKEIELLDDREILFEALNRQGAINEGRTLVHFTHLCNLILDKEKYPVVDIVEYVKGAQVPHGVASLLVLDPSLGLVNKIDYDRGVVPLYCSGDRVLSYGFIMIDGLEPEGNVLTFSEQGKKVVVSYMNPNDFPKLDKLQ